jgi:hypothetical protein
MYFTWEVKCVYYLMLYRGSSKTNYIIVLAANYKLSRLK